MARKKVQKRERIRLTNNSKAILGVLLRSHGRPVKRGEIARRTNLSWPTVDRHVRNLIVHGYLKSVNLKKKKLKK